jgi:uncharacterized protein with von Willebrand factor type A (vWA) domain
VEGNDNSRMESSRPLRAFHDLYCRHTRAREALERLGQDIERRRRAIAAEREESTALINELIDALRQSHEDNRAPAAQRR